jgi:outer membrane protein
MKVPVSFLALLLIVILLPAPVFALGLEVALGGWAQSPSGEVGYKQTDTFDLESDARYEDETRMAGRAKLDLPLFLPNIYLMYSPIEFDGTGQRVANLSFGDTVFSGGVDFTSNLVLNQFDVALYYGIPFLETATLDKLNIELGINFKIIDFSAEVSGTDSVTNLPRTESSSATIPVPMAYVGVMVRPVEWMAVEAEGRAIAYSGNHYYDWLGRLKVIPAGPFFVAAGYRMQDILIDVDDNSADLDFSGPFVEAGIEF